MPVKKLPNYTLSLDCACSELEKLRYAYYWKQMDAQGKEKEQNAALKALREQLDELRHLASTAHNNETTEERGNLHGNHNHEEMIEELEAHD